MSTGSVWSKIPYEILEKVSSRIVNEVKHVNRVVYDITSKVLRNSLFHKKYNYLFNK